MAEKQSIKVPKEEEEKRVVMGTEDFDVKPRISTSPHLKIEQVGMSHQEVLACVTPQAQGHIPVPIKQSLSPTISPSLPRQRSPALPQDIIVCTQEVGQDNSLDQEMELANIVAKAPSTDGYNWRKYGQKQVKSKDSSRSYYRCTHINCTVKKKVQCCDHSGSVLEIVYKGRHNHDQPRKTRHTKARRCSSTIGTISSSEPVEGSGIIGFLVSSDPSTSMRKERHATHEQELRIVNNKEHCEEPAAKRRMKGQNVSCADSLCIKVKEPKVVVQASDDVWISGDGYRWRKYGQKMVKGNPNPRSYYKCTSAGCPVRKHVERATDDTATIMVTYEGKHDHDMPVPKKRHGPQSAGLLIAATAATDKAQPKESNALANPNDSTEWPIDVKGELPSKKLSECGGDKAVDSARTLLSIGIELRPC
ncbi:hypothetical protein IFM89_003156 [Coptis chinensis]|uniref:WRKY domain-containing protein n=1 Tax=Coptis chinensis TaxID=261450 RepID=A0A835I8D3_9MAGN|nr:hypothetical protein IFM89_003156 [Coptis chinensis]